MLIGAHVSPAGGPANAVQRGVERGCHSIQFFNQSPRAWRPREYSDEEVAAYHEAFDGSATGTWSYYLPEKKEWLVCDYAFDDEECEITCPGDLPIPC